VADVVPPTLVALTMGCGSPDRFVSGVVLKVADPVVEPKPVTS
jgi:hypothetical protein